MGAGFFSGGVFRYGFQCVTALCVHRHLHVGQSFAAFLLCPLVFALLRLTPFVFQPGAETECREQVLGYGAYCGESFVGGIFQCVGLGDSHNPTHRNSKCWVTLT